MKKHIQWITVILVIIGLNAFLYSCSTKMLSRSSYQRGHHGTPVGQRLQARASRHAKHFWF